MAMGLVRRVGVQLRLIGGFGIICLLLAAMTWVGVQAASTQAGLTAEVGTLQVLTRDVMQLKFRSADVAGWQVAYAWDVAQMGGVAATDPTSPNRKGFEDSAAALEREFKAVHSDSLTEAERKLFTQVKTQVSNFFEVDKQAVELFQANIQSAIVQANLLILGDGFAAYSKIQSAVTNLVRSVKERSDAAQASAANNANQAKVALIGGCVVALLLAATISVLTTRSIVVPIWRVGSGLRKLATRDLSASLPIVGRDEITEIAKAFNQTAEAMREALTAVGDRAGSLTTSAHHLLTLSESMDTQAGQASGQASVVADAADEISTNVEVIASAAEEMTVSIKEISRSSTTAATVAETAVSTADAASDRVAELTAASAEIGQIVETITTIAEQTNLLALNATIEAARAGESGRGFAIVANEVKELAQQTSQATVDITDKIGAIQHTTDRATVAIGEISDVVREISELQGTVATVVEEQSATTAEINRNLSALASGSQQIAEGISGVAGTAASTSDSAGQARQAAGDLDEMATTLRELVASFRY